MMGVSIVAGLLLASAAQPADTLAPGASASIADLRREIAGRYESALALSLRRDVIAADDTRFLWASEARVQCGIAIGYLKHRIADDDSIRRCRSFAARMEQPVPPPVADTDPQAPTPIPTPDRPATRCTGNLPVSVYFDWNAAEPLPDSAPVIGQVVGSARACGWTALRLVGHADRSGTAPYNLALSDRRAKAVAKLLAAAGFSATALTTQAVGEADPAIATADGVRELMNRRVSIDPIARSE